MRACAARPVIASAMILSLCVALVACDEQADPQYTKEIDTWHAERIARLTKETGWLTLVGLHPLRAGENSVGSAAGNDVPLVATAPAELGTVTVTGTSVALTLADGVAVQVAGNRLTGPGVSLALASDAAGDPTVVESGTLQMYVIARGDLLFLRVKDRASEVRRRFQGIDRFPVDARWRVTARIEPHENHPTVAMPNVLGQIEATASPGTLVFELAGRTCHLDPSGEPGGPLFIVFGDATNGHSTYGGGRFLSADPPSPDGTVILDFNRAYNPPCVFTPYATCPLPPEGNQLPLAVEAGEKMWGDRH